MGDEARSFALKNLAKQFDYLTEQLANRTYLMGDQFTVADAYLFTVLSWAKPATIDLAPWPALTAYRDRVAARPKVQEAMAAEGLIPAKPPLNPDKEKPCKCRAFFITYCAQPKALPFIVYLPRRASGYRGRRNWRSRRAAEFLASSINLSLVTSVKTP